MKEIRPTVGESGFTLIEALVSIIIIAVGFLGLAFLQAQGMAFNTSSYTRSQASNAVYDLADRMRANPNGAIAGGYAATAAPSTFQDCDVGGAACDTAELAAFDLGRWYAQIQADFGGTAVVTWDAATRTYNVTITWGDKTTRDATHTQQQTWPIQI